MNWHNVCGTMGVYVEDKVYKRNYRRLLSLLFHLHMCCLYGDLLIVIFRLIASPFLQIWL